MESSYTYVKEKILDIIRSGDLKDNRLYSEEELVGMLSASRATVREAIRSLENEGILTKRHGVGTFIHPKVLTMPFRIDQAVDFAKMIGDMGCDFGMKSEGSMTVEKIRTDSLDGHIRAQLDCAEEEFLHLTRLYTADGSPAALCNLYFLKSRFNSMPSGQVENFNVDDFCTRYFSAKPDHSMIFLSAENAGQDIADALDIERNTAVQVWDELLYDYRGVLLGYSRIYFSSVIPVFSMLRR